MNFFKAFFCFVFLSFCFSNSFAQIKLPAIISSEMVLQRDAQVNLWGWSQPDELITVKTSWNGETSSTKSDSKGRWQIAIKTNDKRGSQKIIITSSKDEKVLEDILLGEVWLCSGQSNMGMSLKGNKGQPVFDATDAILKSNNNQIRLFQVKVNGAKEPLNDVKEFEPWQKSSPKAASNFSAVAYFF